MVRRKMMKKSAPHDNRQPREEQLKSLIGSPHRRLTTGMKADPKTRAEMAHPRQGPVAELERVQPQGETWIPHGTPQDLCGWNVRRPRMDCVEESRK